MKTLSMFVAVAVAVVAYGSTAHAAHPAYLHALSDLRDARAHLEHPTNAPKANWNEQIAIDQIDAAIKEIKEASIDDGKNIGDHVAVDVALDWGGRLHHANELLSAAYSDIHQHEDDNFSKGLRNRALQHIQAAMDHVRKGMIEIAHEPQPTGDHPAYLHALSDLRNARAWLERPAGNAVKWDEKKAIREIDAAIKEIKEASIDDGKNIDDHPGVDIKMEWGGRLHRAHDALASAYADINQHEDDKFSKGLRNRALKHLQVANEWIEQGWGQMH